MNYPLDGQVVIHLRPKARAFFIFFLTFFPLPFPPPLFSSFHSKTLRLNFAHT